MRTRLVVSSKIKQKWKNDMCFEITSSRRHDVVHVIPTALGSKFRD